MLLDSTKYYVTDTETTTFNKGHRYDPRNILVSKSVKVSGEPRACFTYYTDPGFRSNGSVASDAVVVGFNFKFDFHWLYDLEPSLGERGIWDCQLSEYVYSGQTDRLISLDECLERYGLELKKSAVADLWAAGVQTTDVPLPMLEEYGNWDVIQTENLYQIQQSLLSDKQKNLVYILGEDMKVLVEMERNGILFDSVNARKKVDELQISVASIEAKLKDRLPPIQYGVFNWDSGDHLSCFLYGGTLVFDYATSQEAVYKSGAKKGQSYIKNSWFEETVVFPQRFVPLEGTELAKTKGVLDVITRFYSTDTPTLLSLKSRTTEQKEVLALLSERSKQKKVIEMILSVFEAFETKQWEGNLIHGQYNQNIAATGRLTSSAPNMQNTPPELDEFLVSRYAD